MLSHVSWILWLLLASPAGDGGVAPATVFAWLDKGQDEQLLALPPEELVAALRKGRAREGVAPLESWKAREDRQLLYRAAVTIDTPDSSTGP